MAIKGEIHWCEGLFLQPHHLQIMQRNMLDKFARQSRLFWSHPYGVIEAKVSDDQLENMRVSFDQLRVIMPSGLEVNVPENTHLASLDIKEAFASTSRALTISLGVPVWYPSRGNVIERGDDQDWRAKRTYGVTDIEQSDENTGENPQSVQIRQINARLLLENDDPSDLEVLPLLRIVRATGEEVGSPRRDPAYIPPCFIVSGSSVLRELLQDLTSQVLASRNEMVAQINRGGFSIENMRGVQFEQMLRLRTLNRFSAQLASLMKIPSKVTPFHLYLILRQLLAELAALRPDRDQFEVVDYDHDNLAVSFNELSTRIRGLLKGLVQAKFMKIPLTMNQEQKIFVATLTEEALSLPNEYFLAIRTKQNPSELAKLVSDRDRFKMMPQSLSNQRVFGVQLVQELYPPVELPAQVGLHYFRIMRDESARLWELIKQEKAIAVRWPDVETSDFEITLYMTVPDTEAK
ncbi:MAG: type VI secretion system-associated protein [Deltaproteobacteria bacterium RBG_13_47_9]|nr:MAG: type VI secretion system-associated protein [Deltaproteobacteria bacterium RBG_13_47_9]